MSKKLTDHMLRTADRTIASVTRPIKLAPKGRVFGHLTAKEEKELKRTGKVPERDHTVSAPDKGPKK